MKKTISFAAIHMCVAFSVGYLMTGDVMVGGALALVEPLCNIVAFYFHEKVWAKKEKSWNQRRSILAKRAPLGVA